ncbi:hypothetical protein K9L97_04875 [Candidatus Woesearchaeota archaeon]|nr:hypothetical protein [Candidatus Woesearchaeota archaeon]
MKIIPTIFSKNKKEFEERYKKLSKITKELQIDIMDGKFVKTKSIQPKDLPNFIHTGKTIEAHLMTKNPEKYLKILDSKFVGRIIFHYETIKNTKKIKEFIKEIHKKGMHAILAINPETKTTQIKEIIPEINKMLIMGVKPGKEKQKLLKNTYTKIKEIKKLNQKIQIQIDGGVNKQTAKKLRSAGAEILNTGSYISNAKDPKKTLEELKNI